VVAQRPISSVGIPVRCLAFATSVILARVSKGHRGRDSSPPAEEIPSSPDRRPKPKDKAKAIAKLRAQAEKRNDAMRNDGQQIPHLVVAPADSSQWVELARVTDSAGILTGLGVASGPHYHRFRVEIDGSILAEDLFAGTGGNGDANNGMSVGLPFAQSVVVSAEDEGEPSSTARYWVAFVTEAAAPTDGQAFEEDVEGRKHRYVSRRYTRLDGSRYKITALLGPRLTSRIALARDWVPLQRNRQGEGGYVELAGQVVLSDTAEEVESLAENAPVVIGLPGRRTAIGEGRLATIERPMQIPIPAPGDYSIAASLPGYSNVPSLFTVL